MSTLASLPAFVPDAKALEAARVAVVKAVEGSEKADKPWVTVAATIKAAFPTETLADRPMIREWIASAFSKAERDILAAEVGTVDATVRKAVQSKVSKYLARTLEYAYPEAFKPAAPVAVPPTAAQIVAKAATETAKASGIEAAQAAVDAEIAKAEAAAKAAEAKAEAAKVKAAEAAAKLDPAKAKAAEAAKAKAAEAAKVAEAAKAEAAEAEAAKAEKAAAAKAAQADADAKCLAIQTEKKYGILVADTESLLLLAGGLAVPGIVDFATAVRNALAALKAAQV